MDDQVQLLDQLADLCQRQLDAIGQGRMNELLSLLSEKQQPLERLHQGARQLRQLHDDLQAGGGLPENEAEAFRKAYAAANRRYDQLLTLEQAAEQQLVEGRDRIAERLQATNSGMHVANAYRATDPPPTGGSLDLASS